MTLQETKDYLDSLPGVLALFWFMENVSDEDPNRQDLFFYCRERVRRYGEDWKGELRWDREMFLDREAEQ